MRVSEWGGDARAGLCLITRNPFATQLLPCCTLFTAAFEKLPTFRLASDVNLRARDSQGWSVLHHLVSPLDFGTYDSLAMLRILYDVGGKQLLKIQDKAGLTAVDYSLIKGAPRLSRALQKLLDIDEDKWVSAASFVNQ